MARAHGGEPVSRPCPPTATLLTSRADGSRLEEAVRHQFALVQRLTTSTDTSPTRCGQRSGLAHQRMRSMGSTTRVRGCGLVALGVLLAGAGEALAEPRLACVTIRVDESVPSVARRVTGDARNMRASWFQVVNPTTARWVPKARYDLVFAGWSACIVGERQPEAAIQPSLAVSESPPVPAPYRSRAAMALSLPASRLVTWGAIVWGSLVLGIALGCWGDEYIRRRAVVIRTMRRYAERFVQEFERPLRQPHLAGRPIESRIRCRPFRSRLDVRLAPTGGLRYPNLRDHKKNVLYDVSRVEAAIHDQTFVSSQPYVRGRWVVVPFRLKGVVREAGGR
jgi:hypothetical protein